MGARSCSIGLLVAALVVGLLLSPAVAEGSGGSFWIGNGVGTVGWVKDPQTGLWANVPGSPVDDGFIYKFDLLCEVGSNDFDVACLARYDCDEGENGKAVEWSKSLKVLDPPSWKPMNQKGCVYSTKPLDVMAEIAANIQKKFEDSPIVSGAALAQPSPHTLKGAHTNFYVESATQDFEVQMLGQRVNIHAAPTEYRWTYGDGEAFGPTAIAGGPLPQDRWGEETGTSHVYASTGDFQVVATTTFVGTYSVNGGPPLPIPGAGSFSGTPQTISVWRSITRNYADDCIQNPKGQGCPGVAPPAP